MDPKQYGSETIRIRNNMNPKQYGSETIRIRNNVGPKQYGSETKYIPLLLSEIGNLDFSVHTVGTVLFSSENIMDMKMRSNIRMLPYPKCCLKKTSI